MIKDKHIDFELSKLQKQIDRKKVTKVTTVYNTSPSVDNSIMGKPVASDMVIKDNQTIAYNGTSKQWEAKQIRGVTTFVQATDPANTMQVINGDLWIQVRQSQ